MKALAARAKRWKLWLLLSPPSIARVVEAEFSYVLSVLDRYQRWFRSGASLYVVRGFGGEASWVVAAYTNGLLADEHARRATVRVRTFKPPRGAASYHAEFVAAFKQHMGGLDQGFYAVDDWLGETEGIRYYASEVQILDAVPEEPK